MFPKQDFPFTSITWKMLQTGRQAHKHTFNLCVLGQARARSSRSTSSYMWMNGWKAKGDTITKNCNRQQLTLKCFTEMLQEPGGNYSPIPCSWFLCQEHSCKQCQSSSSSVHSLFLQGLTPSSMFPSQPWSQEISAFLLHIPAQNMKFQFSLMYRLQLWL